MTRNPAFFVQSLAWSAARVCWLLLAGQGRWFFLFLVDVFVRFSVLFFLLSSFLFLCCCFCCVWFCVLLSVFLFFLFVSLFSSSFFPLFPCSFCVLFPAPSFALLALLLVLPLRFGLAWVEYYWRLPIFIRHFFFFHLVPYRLLVD